MDHSRRGRCYELAGREVSDNGGTLVHGTIVSLRFATPIGHAWVERADGTVWEPVTEVTHTAERFTELLQAVPIRRYDQEAVWVEMLRQHTWGPWEDDTSIPDPEPFDPKVLERLAEINKEGTE
jgi:hypothetical protein